jgi:hypothetical protein
MNKIQNKIFDENFKYKFRIPNINNAKLKQNTQQLFSAIPPAICGCESAGKLNVVESKTVEKEFVDKSVQYDLSDVPGHYAYIE